MFYFTVIFIIVTKGKTILLFSLIEIPKMSISYISRNHAFKKNNLEKNTNGKEKKKKDYAISRRLLLCWARKSSRVTEFSPDSR